MKKFTNEMNVKDCAKVLDIFSVFVVIFFSFSKYVVI